MEERTLTSEKFQFAKPRKQVEEKAVTKSKGYFSQTFSRFGKSKSTLVGGIIVLLLLLYALLTPVLFGNAYTKSGADTAYLWYAKIPPRSSLLSPLGGDGISKRTENENSYLSLVAIGEETGLSPVRGKARAFQENGSTYYRFRYDAYYGLGLTYAILSETEYLDLQRWQTKTGVQVIFPAVDYENYAFDFQKNDANLWYEITPRGAPVRDTEGNFRPVYLRHGQDGGVAYTSLRIKGDDGSYRYARITGDSSNVSYRVRVSKYNYFRYRYGFKPRFAFGTDDMGRDIFTRLALGARFSFALSLGVSLLNFLIGVVYGAIAGYYGGRTDLLMGRVSDIINGIPFTVVAVLFQLHLAKKLGAVVALLFAFVLTGWIGLASTTRMQFYRYKNREYVLAARTMGASDFRIVTRHIFPNAIGTIITSFVLAVPSVIFGESSLSYLGIVNLEGNKLASVGTMLASGKNFLSTNPHILLFPALFISLMMIAFNLLGNGLRDSFNEKTR